MSNWSEYLKFLFAVITFSFLSFPMSSYASEIIFKDRAGRILTKEDIKGISGDVKWEINSGTPIPEEAKRLHDLGRVAGQKGESKAAISYFRKASEIAPNWPYPYYDLAFTYLLNRDFENAYDAYKRVDNLAPRGFFTTKTAVHSLQGERNGKYPQGTYLFYLSLEWTNDLESKQKIVDQLLRKVPNFAPAWKEMAALGIDDSKRLDYLDKGLKADPDLETKGFLLINKALIFANRGRKNEAIPILGALALDPTSPLDIEVIAKKTLSMIVSK
ncbi:tetratricopeptide repeat protein [Collimonas arenae]|uniref:tetratricopeptide repeat protein n=1 Tax=Collimonas arenae TaxID=279058 RepID=UPI00077834E5|nr:hypothetical protein [Collimonas arenae]